MANYKVVGYYEDNGQAYVGESDAGSPWDAFAEVAKNADVGLVLVCAINMETGESTTPCDNSGDTCFACDYPVDEEDFTSLCAAAYEEGGVSDVELLITTSGTEVDREFCEACDTTEAPTLPGTHECLYCGSPTSLVEGD